MATDFANYLSMPTRVPLRVWHAIRFVSIAVLLVIAVAAWFEPDTLTLFWGLVVPVLPAVFLIAPGSWRNVCPLAGVNQASRYLGKDKQLTPPKWFADHGFTIATLLFFSLALSRKVLFNGNGKALSVLLIVLLVGAAIGGRYFRGKSGWCSSICPLLPVQRVYGQTPFIGVPNSHCRPCLGCTTNCYDFNPRVAYVADMHEADPGFRGPRRLFVGAFPGLVLGYFLVPDAGSLSVLEVYGRCLMWIAGTVAVFAVLDAWGRFSPNTLPPLFGGAAFVLFYWFGVRKVIAALDRLFDVDAGWLLWPVRVSAIALGAIWLLRSWKVQRDYVEETAVSTPVQIDLARARSGLDQGRGVTADGNVEIDFEGRTVAVKVGTSLLEAATGADLSIESGCRMGVCGADPVAVTEGYDALSPIRKDEADTLERLGLGWPNRMACVARAQGGCSVSLRPDRSGVAVPSGPAFTPDPDVRRVVVVGNGIGGVTTVDFLRRNHPDCEIAIVGMEPHQFYNRMGVARLIHGRSAMQGLYLLPADWYEQHGVRLWLNTRVTRVDAAERTVHLGTGESLPYDHLVLAVGGGATRPAIGNFGLSGCFVLREADDAMRIRAYVQQRSERRAVVAGGGLLGLEAAHALHELGMTVTVLERSHRLLRNSLDEAASEVLRSFFEALGITIVTDSECERVEGDGWLERVVTKQGTVIDTEVLLVAAGVTPHLDLARSAGLVTSRGVVVDERMRTSDPHIWAVGDVAEFNGRVWGLWPVAVEQAQVAAVNIAGGDKVYADSVPTTVLKGAGLDALSFGEIDGGADDVVVAHRGAHNSGYRKVVVREGRVVGGVFLGFAEDAQQALDARDTGRELDDDDLAALARGDWSALHPRVTQPA